MGTSSAKAWPATGGGNQKQRLSALPPGAAACAAAHFLPRGDAQLPPPPVHPCFVMTPSPAAAPSPLPDRSPETRGEGLSSARPKWNRPAPGARRFSSAIRRGTTLPLSLIHI